MFIVLDVGKPGILRTLVLAKPKELLVICYLTVSEAI